MLTISKVVETIWTLRELLPQWKKFGSLAQREIEYRLELDVAGSIVHGRCTKGVYVDDHEWEDVVQYRIPLFCRNGSNWWCLKKTDPGKHLIACCREKSHWFLSPTMSQPSMQMTASAKGG